MEEVKPGQAVITPLGKGQVLHPVIPGITEGKWYVLLGKMAHKFTLEEMKDANDGQAETDTQGD